MQIQQYQNITLKEGQYSPKLYISQNVENKFRFLCQELPKVEWSGVLFYTITGSFIDRDIEIHCKDILLLDVGTSGFTEYKINEDIISYQVENDLLDCYTGLYHSHNTMKTFFSGTDINTLKAEGIDSNHFLSLIVNNDGEYTARITKKVYYEYKGTVIEKYNTFEDEKVIGKEKFFEKESKDAIIEYYNLDIHKPTITKIKSDIELKNKIEELIAIKEEEAKKLQKNWHSHTTFHRKDFNFDKYEKSYYQPSLFSEDVIKKKPDEDYEMFVKLSANHIMTGNLLSYIGEPIQHIPHKLDAKFRGNIDLYEIYIDRICEYVIDSLDWYFHIEDDAFYDDFINDILIIIDKRFPESKYKSIICNTLDNYFNRYADY